MKLLDKYVAKNFLVGYFISLFVLIGLRIIIDLFVNLDEFTEHIDLGAMTVLKNIISYYSIQAALYFRDFAGMITVIAAAFSLGKMTRNNELTAVMASGVSLKRVIAPIFFLALVLGGLFVIDQEFIIPHLADKLVRSQDTLPGEETYDVWFISDENGSLFCSRSFDVKTATFIKPTIITRQRISSFIWKVTGKIDADKAIYNNRTKEWDLINGQFSKISEDARETAFMAVKSYKSDLTPKEIPVRRQATNKTLLSSRQLSALAAQGTKVKDQAQLYSQKHFRITDPIINLIMLMIGLPILVCREPKAMKTAIAISFGATAACFVTTFICKMVATEMFFSKVRPEFWAWVPVFIFLPIALIELDAMKT